MDDTFIEKSEALFHKTSGRNEFWEELACLIVKGEDGIDQAEIMFEILNNYR